MLQVWCRSIVLLGLTFAITPWAQADVCDVDNSCAIDRADISLIRQARGSVANPGDPRDANGDGLIDVNDARACVVQCTLGRCSPVVNVAPVATVGPDQTLESGVLITLSGSGNDDNGNPITFAWTLNSPAGSTAVLSDASAANPTFVADVAGVYSASLVVSDCSLSSDPAVTTITVEAGNTEPVADAGPDQGVDTGDVAQLNGNGSFDADGDALTFLWELTPPAGSAASLSDPNIVNPSFVADIAGLYTVSLVVNDGTVDSVPDFVNVTAVSSNIAPVADAGPDQGVDEGALVQLSGNGSFDADGDALTYLWMLSVPNGSTAVLSDATAVNPTFIADIPGVFSASLVVNDGSVDSAADSVVITAIENVVNVPPVAVDDEYSGRIGEPLMVEAPGVLGNDTDANGDALTAQLLTPPVSGTATVNADGSITYVSNVIGNEVSQNINLTLEASPLVRASSEFRAAFAPALAIDEDLNSSWFTKRPPDAEEWIEQEWNADVTAKEIQIFGHRGFADGFDFTEGFVQLFDADGLELYNSGILALPAPVRDLVIDLVGTVGAVEGVRRMRFTGTDTENAGIEGGLAEFYLIGDGISRLIQVDELWSFTDAVDSSGNQIGMALSSTPVVIDLDGDNDPETVFAASTRQLVALNSDGSIHFVVGGPSDLDNAVGSFSAPAVGDIDGDGEPEIVAIAVNSTFIRAWEADGTLKWTSEQMPPAWQVSGAGLGAVAIADLNQDGSPEIVVGGGALIGVVAYEADGSIFWATRGGSGNNNYVGAIPIVSDIDLDGSPDVIAGNTAYNADGTVKWTRADLGDGWNAVGNFDADPQAEVVLVSNQTVHLLEHDGQTKQTAADFTTGRGGAPTVADFDNDGAPEIGVAGANRYIVYDTDMSTLWTAATVDFSSSTTGSSVFDFENDGLAEVVYRDEQNLFIFDGATGSVRLETPVRSSTGIEAPVIADIDGNGTAEILITADISIAGGRAAGMYAFTSGRGQWANTRPLWNQHSYHVTNVNDDGSIPIEEAENWLVGGLNDFRRNAFLDARFGLSDSFTYIANDGLADSNVATVSIDLLPANTAPEFTSAALEDAEVGIQYLYAATATDLDGDTLTFSLVSGPAGMVVDGATGLVQWDPIAAGTEDVTLRVEDPDQFSDTQFYTITVAESSVNTAPTADAGPDQSVDAGSQVSLDGSASSDPQNDALTYAWTLNVPAGSGASLSDPNIVNPTFVADVPGDYTANLTVSDGEFDSPVDSATTMAIAVNQPPTLAAIVDRSTSVGSAFSVQANGDDPDVGDTLTYSLPIAPAGMSIDPDSGLISWMSAAGQIGPNAVQVRVEDAAGLFATQDFTVTVVVGNQAPIAVDDEDFDVVRQSSLAVAAPGVLGNDSDPDGNVITAALVTDVSQGVLNLAADGSFDYTPELLPETVPEMQQQCSRDISEGNGGAGGQQANATLAVGDVDNDGDIEIVGAGYITNAGIPELWILNASDCSVQLATSPDVIAEGGITQSSHLGLLDIDGDGDLEIIAARLAPGTFGGSSDHLIAMHHDGTLAWANGSSEDLSVNGRIRGWFGNGPIFADLNADGVVEIVMSYEAGVPIFGFRPGVAVFDSRDGSVLWEYNEGPTTLQAGVHLPPAVADLDLDGTLEVIYYASVLDHNGNLEFELDTARVTPTALPGYLISAVANFDTDAFPELIVRDRQNHYLLEHDGTVKWQIARDNTSTDQIAVADFDGDGEMEYAYNTRLDQAANLDGYMVMFDTDGSILWSHENEPTLQVSSVVRADGTNPIGFDYNRDGAVDLVVHYELLDPLSPGVYIFDGRDGSVLEHLPTNKYNPGFAQAFTTIADVDGDGEAEIVTSYTGGIEGETIVWGSAPGSTLPAVPNFRNQWVFNLAMVNPDLSIPANPVPAWLRPGMNGYNYLPVAIPLDPVITDTFEYRANDGSVDSNIATAFIDILPFGQNAPVFVSDPDTKATVGFAYDYVALTADTNFGDTLTYSLVNGPAGMSVNPNTGRVSWPGDVAGDYPVTLEVSDGLFTDNQAYTITVGDPVVVPDVLGQTLAAAAATLTGADLEVGLVTREYDVAAPIGTVIEQTPTSGQSHEFGGAVDLVLSLGPAPEDVDNDGDGFTENDGDCNDSNDTIFPGAVDIPDDGIDQDCSGSDATSGPALASIVVTPASATLIVGQSQALTATGVLADGTSRDLTGTVVWSNGGSVFDAVTPGSFTIEATTDGITGSSQIDVVAVVGGDSTPPVASITSPAANASVTEPIDVVGTATDANFIKYSLSYAVSGSDQFTQITEQTSPVSDGVLGQFDPTLLINDQYTLRLEVFDAAGFVSTIDRVVLIEQDLKVGNFSLSFTDASVPMSGIPLSVVRNYDSRRKTSGDFGFGWSLDIQSLRCSSNRILGSGWQTVPSGFFGMALVPTDEHYVSITLPDGQVEKFNMRPNPTSSPFGPFPALSITISFAAQPGTLGSLIALDDNTVSIFDAQPGVATLSNFAGIYDPQRFRYTAADGTSIVFDKTNGVESITDPSGNTLTINQNGLIHSAGKSITFERDATGRITKLIDPAGNEQTYTYDANGDLIVHTDAENFATKFAYNRNHGLLRVTDPLDRVITRNEFDDDGRLISTTNSDGRTIQFANDLDSRQQIVTDADGGLTVMEYDDKGNILRVTDALGGVTSHTYDADGNQTSTTNAIGQVTQRTFDARGNRLAETNAAGETRTFAYNAQNRITSRTDALGRVTTYEYDANGRLVRQIDASGTPFDVVSYTAAGQVESVTDANGRRMDYEYDASGNRTALIDALGGRHESVYNANGELIQETDPLGRVVTTTVDSRGLFSSMSDSTGNSMAFNVSGSGNLVGVADALGNEVSVVTDALGKDLSFTDAEGHTTSKTYDILGNLASVTDAEGRVTRYEYDALSRRIKTIGPDGGEASVVYDAIGRITSTTSPNGATETFEYDASNRNTKRTDALGFSTDFSYDSNGNLIEQIDAAGNVFTFVYDTLDRLVRTNNPDGSFTTKTYDSVGNIISETDALGRTTSYSYDAHNNLLTVVEPGGVQTSFTYDALNNLLTQTDGLGRVTSFEYDSNGRRIRKIYPGGGEESLVYDLGSRVANSTDANGDTTHMESDSNGRVLRKVFSDNSEETFTYTNNGQVATATSTNGTVTYAYDFSKRLSRITQVDGSYVAYEYDLNGNRTEMRTSVVGGPDRITTYTYDALDRVVSVVDPSGGILTNTYDSIGNLASRTYPNGVVSTFTYDALSRLSNLRHVRGGTVVAEYDYAVNAVGDRTRVVHADGTSVNYEYDQRRRLTKETHLDLVGSPVFELSYSYDAVGNRTATVDLNGVAVAYAYNLDDQLVAVDGSPYSYDANGNLIQKTSAAGNISYTYDHENQLTDVVTPAGAVNYKYDASGERVSRSAAGSTTDFLVDPNNSTGVSQVVVDYVNGNLTSEYTYGSELISVSQSGSTHYAHADGSSNIRRLTDSTGSITDSYEYTAFGETLSETGNTLNPYRFAGERYDSMASLVYLRARYYDPATGRFISRDPFEGVLSDPVSLHRYLYANTNPIAFKDPTGKYTVGQMALVSGIISFSITFVIEISKEASLANLKRSLVRASISGAIGALTGAFGAAAGVGGTVTTNAVNSMTRLIGSKFFGKQIVYGAILFAKSAASTLFAWIDVKLAVASGSAPPEDIANFPVGQNLVINFLLEAFTLGFVDSATASRASAAAQAEFNVGRQALANGNRRARRLLGQFMNQSEDDLRTFLARIAGPGSHRNRAAQRALAEMEEVAQRLLAESKIFQNSLDQVGLFFSTGANILNNVISAFRN